MIWFKRIVLSLSIIIIVAGGLFALIRESNLFRVRQIPVKISTEIDETQEPFRADPATVVALRERLKGKLKVFKNQKIWEIKITDIKRALGADEWVQNLRVTRSFPNRLEVEITPRAAVFLITNSKGKLAPVAADGSLLNPVSSSILPDVPVLKAEKVLSDKSLRTKAIEFAKQLPKEGPLSLDNMSELSWSQNEGFVASLLASKATVILGEDKVAMKVARIEKILDYLTANELNSRVIDASYSKKVLVRLRKGP